MARNVSNITVKLELPDELRQPENGREQRSLAAGVIELREDADGPILSGLAVPYDSWSEPIYGMFYEKVMPGSCKRAFAKDADVMALNQHDSKMPLGRTTAGTLTLTDAPDGVRFELRPPDTGYGKDLVLSVKRKDITGMSFGFRTIADKWNGHKDELPIRELHEIELNEISPVTWPAYLATQVAARSLRAAEEIKQKWRIDLEARSRRVRLACSA